MKNSYYVLLQTINSCKSQAISVCRCDYCFMYSTITSDICIEWYAHQVHVDDIKIITILKYSSTVVTLQCRGWWSTLITGDIEEYSNQLLPDTINRSVCTNVDIVFGWMKNYNFPIVFTPFLLLDIIYCHMILILQYLLVKYFYSSVNFR